jgi:hypothetical protein
MKQLILLLSMILSISFQVIGQQIPIPKNYSIIDTVSGDLDNDGISELVAAYNAQKENDDDDLFESIPRELIIYKKQNNKWILWKNSKQALYGSKDGGMMGDPFGSIAIEKGILNISQDGGSSWKWGHTDKYRYQNGGFILIGYTSAYGKPCEYWETVDFNLSTGKIIVKKEYEECEDEEQKIFKRENESFYKKGLKITLENRSEKEIMIVTPKYKHEIYVAVKNE